MFSQKRTQRFVHCSESKIRGEFKNKKPPDNKAISVLLFQLLSGDLEVSGPLLSGAHLLVGKICEL